MRKVFNKHEELVVFTKRELTKQFKGKKVKIFELRPIPDLIMVDFEKKEVWAIEVSNRDQIKDKIPRYKGLESDFKHVLIARVKITETEFHEVLERHLEIERERLK